MEGRAFIGSERMLYPKVRKCRQGWELNWNRTQTGINKGRFSMIPVHLWSLDTLRRFIGGYFKARRSIKGR